MSTPTSHRARTDHGWFFQAGVWRPVKVLSQDDYHLIVQLRDGTTASAGMFDFLWERPTDRYFNIDNGLSTGLR
jgi:hypothetical protein